MLLCHFVTLKGVAGLADVDVVFEDLAAAAAAVHPGLWPQGSGGMRRLSMHCFCKRRWYLPGKEKHGPPGSDNALTHHFWIC